MEYTIASIAQIISGQLIQTGNQNPVIRNLVIDSRKTVIPDTSLFFALITTRNNGHKYLLELHEKGLRNFVVSEMPENTDLFKESVFIKVNNTLDALQTLASYHRKQFHYPVIGITGSNGKTIVKEWLFQLMEADKKIVRSPKSYNSQVGVPLSVWQMSETNDLAIIEAGISEPEEMQKLQAIIQPSVGIFTNIGSAHEKNFLNIRQKTGEKLHLFKQVETLIYCSDYFDIQDRIIQSEILKKVSCFTWSTKHPADLNITGISKQHGLTMVKANYLSREISIEIPFTDNASVENAVHCWAYLLLSGYSDNEIKSRFRNLIPVAMRLELKAGINNCSVINDSYSSDLNSLSIALDFMNQQQQHKKRTLILSDILQSAMNDSELYNEISGLLNTKGVSRIIGIGEAISRHQDCFSIEKVFYKNTDEFLNKYNASDYHNETILIKGARKFEFENISKILQQKSHETVMEINLNALVHNLNYYRSQIGEKVKVMAMVKAFSYGSGGFEIANILQYHKVDYLAVAYPDEGIDLRKAGIKTPIMVMNPEEDSFALMNKYQLEPEIYNFRILRFFIDHINSSEFLSHKKHPVHIKLDTGMNRLGFRKEEIPELLSVLDHNKTIEVKSVFTHLACSEDVLEDDFTQKQIEELTSAGKLFKEKMGDEILLHALNSSGITRFPEAQLDMVRIGIGLYGIAFAQTEQISLQNVSVLRSIISQIKLVKAGDTVGYGRKWKAEKDTIIGIVPVGYADGLNRKLGNGNGYFFVQNHKAPVIGNVCMDMCMIDLSGINAQEGDECFLFNDAESIKTLATILETIPYEILTSVSGRVKRVYYYE
jgi:alanine racemase